LPGTPLPGCQKLHHLRRMNRRSGTL
jgi:hypothetical protein